MHYLRDLTVLILGLGDSGLAMARWCARCGAHVRVADTRATPPQAGTLAADVPAATLHQGLDVALLDGVNLVLKSPGLMPNDPAVAALTARADALGIPVRGELSLFASALADLKTDLGYAPKVVAITGTNGKTTTTSLTAQLIERAGLRVGMAGNIGPTLLDTLRVALDAEPARESAAEQTELAFGGDASVLPGQAESGATSVQTEPDLGEGDASSVIEASADDEPAHADVTSPDEEAPAVAPLSEDADAPLIELAPPTPAAPTFEVLPEAWVLELSSFQLDGVSNFEPDAAVVLNITQDHLDWHGSMAAYAAAKARIYGKQAVMVINRDDPEVAAMVPPPEVIKSGVRGRPAKLVHRQVVRFGLDMPQHPGDFGLVTESGMAWLVRAREADPTLKLKKGEQHEIILQRLMPADALRIRGRHNASNALAALALSTAIGCPLAPMLHGLREYRGEPHRVEHVTTVGGVDAIDDSKGTNVGATVAALLGLGADLAPGKLVVILGGDGKGQDFGPLAEPVGRFARAVALIGQDAPALQAVLAEVRTPTGEALPMARHDSLEAATRWAFEQASAGDAVLLSPACASLDMFRNYAHRAEVFVTTVRELAIERGDMA
ncbi:MAG: UDP-N-acetylmuramoyl-L-alanine--D-glutamate ligase [Aquabacterium sp.]|jgi:UDP-N-acetylmuramoylalanine--D-glutamate ligase|uniref:UDP-N-acetylmuramoyl-L-alanine--D-glutamate ligase n=1 Tax=Aquabacterium sp. TaxID=1872578 RepID=UPI002A358AEA|nr:UDP-N-acetylmuramoyl-L-alanine--D-glutamate ligase [Aquabacterium sp.]MDX9842615.1 UDP-N-acetylmuramoyl-L-alanine--D-glutamate ligase [Aquabacterium sp.]